MNTYKELIENLRSNTNNVFQQQAADAIEQLMTDINAVRKERNAAVADITELLRQPEVVTRCWACAKWEADGKFVNCSQTSNDCTAECSEAEWRGVQK